ncbi:MAG: toprim domain-containing protein [Burkholderiales bacterium]
MARIPEAEIERLKETVAVERLAEGAGVALRKAGKDLLGKCCFHEDDQASLVVTPAKNLWHCFGCGAGGGPIDWVMKAQGVSFRHAVELLREGAPSLAAKGVARTRIRVLAAPVAIEAEDQVVLGQVIGYYHETLKTSPEALAYMKARGIASAEAIDKFRLGYANRTLGLRLPEKTRKTGLEIRTRLERLGIYRDSGHEHFNGSLIVPVLDEQGHVTEVYGRKVRSDLRPGTPLHLYLPGPHRGVWNVEALAASKEIILCEALIDALSFWCAGFRNVTASYGTAGFTDDHLNAFKRHGTERVLIAYDRDEPGDRAAASLAERLTAEGLECYRIEFPKGMDANEYALKVQPPAKSLGVAIRKASWLGKGKAPQRAEVEPVEAPALIVEEPRAEASARRERLAQVRASAPSSLAADLAAKVKTEDAAERVEPSEPALPATPMPLAASPLPAAPAAEAPAEVTDTEVVFTFGANGDARRYRIRGLAKNLAYEVLKVNVLVEKGEALHVDTFDLRSTKPKDQYIARAASELRVPEEAIRSDLANVFHRLEGLQEQNIKGALKPKRKAPEAMESAEREAALAYLRAPRLVERIESDLTACGLVGEPVNKVVAYLAASSRKLDQPLAVLVQSSSAAGKTSLMDAVLALMPEEERIKYSAVTGQSLFYLGGEDLKHKILAIVEEEGASRAAYALKLLQSEGELTIASTAKNPETGELQAQTYTVKGPVALFSTTTAAEIDPELQNRCMVLAVDESREQTRSIHEEQRSRRTLEGLARRAEREEIRALHQNAQRLLRPLAVLNPYAPALTFPDTATRLRRDHEKYLTLIDTIALVHQYQRELKAMQRRGKVIEYIEATLEDVALANEIAHEVLGRSLDELPPQTRRVLGLVDAFVAERARAQGTERSAVRFSRRELREATSVGDTQLRLHLDRLVLLEYVLVHRGTRGASFVYELVYDGAGADGKPFIAGLIDVEALKAAATTANLAGQKGGVAGVKSEFAGSMRGESGPNAGGRGVPENATTPEESNTSARSSAKSAKTHSKGGNGAKPSYTHPLAAKAR